ncbi:hypothetical protein SAMN06265222_10765 [Neorhodopirellula lusitana]|uniref:Uncharacterized protein n=1 Tax=Neorhodopirellula lusitana TaxID=445327 RepID=A0ABY1Q8P2_9BACT|nr:hypothetical protein SAMN06265222_10765 [Neorhodopirellula lusitana]
MNQMELTLVAPQCRIPDPKCSLFFSGGASGPDGWLGFIGSSCSLFDKLRHCGLIDPDLSDFEFKKFPWSGPFWPGFT